MLEEPPMSTKSALPQTGENTWPDSGSDEIDLTRYFNVVRQRWLEIVLVTVGVVVLAGVGVLLYRQMTPPVYEANATAAIVRTSTDVRFDERFTTTSDGQGLDVNSRRTALVALVKSGSIAQQVIEEMGEQLPAGLRNPAELLNMITAELATASGRAGTSDLIQISAMASSPELAADIANAWVKAYVQQVNSIYGQVPDDMLGSVEAQLVEAQATYNTAQANLESFLAASQLDALTRQSGVISQTLGILQQGRIDALNSYMSSLVGSYGNIVQTYVNAQAQNQVLAFNKEQEGQRARVAAYLDALNAAQVDTFTGQSDSLRSELRMYYDQWLRTNSLLSAARTLQQQVADSTGDTPSSTTLAASTLALQMLNLQMVNAAAATPPQPSTSYLTPGQLQVQLNNSGAAASAADLKRQVDAAVTSLEGQLTALQQNIAKLNQSLLSGDSFQDLNAQVPADSALAQAVASAYPSLFQSSVLSDTALQPGSTALFAAGQDQAAKFLALAENGNLPTANSPDAPLATTIADLEAQLRGLQGQIEVQRARNLQFTEQRDLAWESVQALANKQAELQLARAAANSEVRLSGQAVPLDTPVPQVRLTTTLALAAVLGLLLGLIVAFICDSMDLKPLVAAGWPRALIGKIGAL